MSIGIQNGNVYGTYSLQATLTPVAVSASRTAGQNFTATNFPALANLRVGDQVFVNPPLITTGVSVCAAQPDAEIRRRCRHRGQLPAA